tara:strand:+ start:72 stop:371 length:300 start_codon:yes stop_codon:yes gene_type:complete
MSDEHKETIQTIMEFTENLQRQASRLFAEADDLIVLKGMFTDITQKVHEMMLDLHKHKHFRDITNEIWMHHFTLMHHTFVQREREIIESQARLNAESIH